MYGTKVEEEDSEYTAFLTAINGSVRYPSGEPIRCDQCSEVIHKNRECAVLFTDRLVSDNEPQDIPILARIECSECGPTNLQYSPVGYTELLLSARYDTDLILQDIHVRDTSARSEGFDWNVDEVQQLIEPKESTLEDLSATGLIRLIGRFYDPRKIIDPDTGEILIPPEQRDVFRVIFLKKIFEEDTSKDEIKAIKQGMDKDVSEERIEEVLELLS
jgi:hypothetical protein